MFIEKLEQEDSCLWLALRCGLWVSTVRGPQVSMVRRPRGRGLAWRGVPGRGPEVSAALPWQQRRPCGLVCELGRHRRGSHGCSWCSSLQISLARSPLFVAESVPAPQL